MTPPASSAPCLFLILLNHSRLEIVYSSCLSKQHRGTVSGSLISEPAKEMQTLQRPRATRKTEKEQGGVPTKMTLAGMACAVTGEMALGDLMFLSW